MVEPLKSATVAYGNLFAQKTGATLMLLLLANNWALMVLLNFAAIESVANNYYAHAGGYTVSTRYISNRNRNQLNPVSYHCNGTENNLQNCDRENQSRCSNGVKITCVQRNSSGMTVV